MSTDKLLNAKDAKLLTDKNSIVDMDNIKLILNNIKETAELGGDEYQLESSEELSIGDANFLMELGYSINVSNTNISWG